VTFAARPHLPVAAGGGPVSLGAISVEDYTLPDAVEIAFKSNGVIDYLGNTVMSGPSNWYSPTTTGIGSGYDIKFTLLSGDAWDAGLVSGTAYNLSTDRQLTLSSTSTDKSLSASVQILLAGTSTVAYTATLSLGIYIDP
jgi:hypothetical protein